MRATIIAAIITTLRHPLAILIVARFPPRLSRYRPMATDAMESLRARREAVVNAHIEAEAVKHDLTATLATFRHPRYEVPSVGVIADGAEAVEKFLTGVLGAFPDLWVKPFAFYHADDAVIVECRWAVRSLDLLAISRLRANQWKSRAS